MSELMENKILQELHSFGAKLDFLNREVSRLREDYSDTHLSNEEREIMNEAFADEKSGKLISAFAMKKKLRL